MKTVILTCNTGGGHNSSANALKEVLEANGQECDIVNYLSFTNKAAEKIITDSHILLYRHAPRLFGFGYRFEEDHAPKFIYTRCAETADKLYSYLNEGGYDTVICVHVFAALAMTEIRKRYNPPIKQYFIATDYTCSPGVADMDVDKYFIPLGCREEFAAKGVPNGRIFETGIPIAPQFYKKGDKIQARRALSLCEDGPIAVLMCGSMGAGPMNRLTRKISQNLPDNATLVVVCGSNKPLYNSLCRKALRCVKAVGFTDKMNSYLDAADLLISKPGGLSSTESFFKHIPLLCIDLVRGCETRNYEFFKKRGYCFCAENINELAVITPALLSNTETLEKMAKRIEEEFTYNAAELIFSEIF